jgi:integrase/recombinase XerD
MRTLAIASPEDLRQADHKAVIAWERYMRETEHPENLVSEVERPAINRDEGSTLAFAKAAGAQNARRAA